jgi:membrane protein
MRGRGGGGGAPRRDSRPAGVRGKPTLFGTLRRTVTEFSEDNLTVWAAALTYYGLLSLFPALIALAAIVGLFASPQTITDVILEIAPPSAAETLSGPIDSITSNSGTAGLMLLVGLLIALWGASSYVGAFMHASNVIYETPEGRPFWKLRPLQVLVTLVMVTLLALVTLAVVLTGPLADAIAGPLGIGGAAVTAWDYAKWPVLAVVVILMFAVLYYTAPNVRLVGFKWVTPGVILAMLIWIVASALFAFYVANFGSYDRTYGTLGGVVVLLVWLWITNVALLLGAEFNAERERTRELKAGIPGAEREIQLEPRSDPKRPRTS